MVRGRAVADLQQAALVGEWQKPSRPAGESRSSFSQTLGNSGVGRHAHTFDHSRWQISVCTAYCSPTTIDIRFRQRELEQPKFNYWVPSRLDPRFQRPLSHHSPGRAPTLPHRSATWKLESVVKMPDSLPGFGLASQSLQGLAFLSIGLDGAPLVARDQGSSQIYAIKWQN